MPPTSRRVVVTLRDDGVATVTLKNPPQNLTTLDTIDQLLDACQALASHQQVRAVVVTGYGERAFCAGSDIKEFDSVRNDVVGLKLRKENEAFTAIEQLPQPVIAALNGVTLGGGAELALACDLRVMDGGARIGFPEINLGVFPGSGGVFRLPRAVGLARAYELLYSGHAIDASEANRIGLVNRVTPVGQALPVALDIAARLASKPPLALRLIKTGARQSLTEATSSAVERTLADSHLVFTGPDIDEGVTAFLEKRAPQFRQRSSSSAEGAST